MQVSRAKNPLATRAHAAADEIKPLLTDVALRGHVRSRKDANETH